MYQLTAQSDYLQALSMYTIPPWLVIPKETSRKPGGGTHSTPVLNSLSKQAGGANLGSGWPAVSPFPLSITKWKLHSRDTKTPVRGKFHPQQEAFRAGNIHFSSHSMIVWETTCSHHILSSFFQDILEDCKFHSTRGQPHLSLSYSWLYPQGSLDSDTW